MSTERKVAFYAGLSIISLELIFVILSMLSEYISFDTLLSAVLLLIVNLGALVLMVLGLKQE